MKKNLILGIIDNYDYFRVERFLNSLFKTKFTGHICIFSGPGNDPYLVNKLKKLNIEVVSYTPTFPFLDNIHPDNFKSLPDPIHIFNYRHFIYYNYLLENKSRFEHVLLTDIRDVIFQNDPFDFGIEDALYVALETTKISEDEWTSNWILNGYSSNSLESIKNNFVTCAGTTMGSCNQIMRYLESMLHEISQVKDAYNCADQAIQNVLLYKGVFEPTIRLENSSGIIMTVGTANPSTFMYDKDGYLIAENGRRANIVHQADRHLALQAKLDEFIFRKPVLLSVLKKIYHQFPQLTRYLNLLKRKFS